MIMISSSSLFVPFPYSSLFAPWEQLFSLSLGMDPPRGGVGVQVQVLSRY